MLSTVAVLAAASGACDTGEELSADDLTAESAAVGTTYQVGPGRTYTELSQVVGRLVPGDVVQVDYRSTPYAAVLLSKSGTSTSPIRITGLRNSSGLRPMIAGGTNTIEAAGNYNVIEGFDLSGGSSRVFFHHAHMVTLRDSKIHDCPSHGILGADSDAGSLTAEYLEVTRCGAGDTRHPVYMATDETVYPGSVFTLRYSWIHDNNGGNAVKSRAERNVIAYNWIENAYYREIELIGPDGQDDNLKREDSDVVGNVFVKGGSSTAPIARIGGDGTGDTGGRYRFAWNVFIQSASSGTAIQMFDRVETVELHNNVFYKQGGGGVRLLNTSSAIWTTGSAKISGAKNWIASGSTDVPTQLTGTISGTSPGFTNLAAWDLRPASTSPLLNLSASPTVSPSGYAYPSPITTATGVAARRALRPTDQVTRALNGTLDVGAFEYGGTVTTTEPPPPPPPPPPACQVASATAPRVNTAMAAKTGTFTIEADLTPNGATLDGAFGVSRGSQTSWTGLANIVLFNAGTIQVRDGSAYRLSTYPYVLGLSYHVRVVINITAHTYSVYVRSPNATEVLLGGNMAFRTEQAMVTSLDNYALFGDGGSLQACNVSIH